MTAVRERARFLLMAGAVALCLVAGSPARVVGDGGEYLTQALNFATLHLPPLGRRALIDLQPVVTDLAPHLEQWNLREAVVLAPDRTGDFLHFWFYALLATPYVWLTWLVGISPLHAFTLLNLTILGTALWVAWPRLGPWLTMLLFAGPLVWWIDKAHTEIFTVSLLTIAVLTMRDRPWWALVSAGAAATQNPPVTIVVLLILGVLIVERRAAVLTDRRLIAGAGAGLALAALGPVYTFLRHGTPSLLLYATRPGFPTWAEISAPVIDPSLGLVGNYPLFLAGLLAAGAWLSWKHPRTWLTPEMCVTVCASLVFLYSFARTSNVHHGATPSLTRYALWLIPMSMPLWIAARDAAGVRARPFIAAMAVVSAVVSVFAFHPRIADNSREPTWLAAWVWGRHPSWHNPLPEVFAETHLHREGTRVPAATPGCEKILLAGSAGADGVWPIPCMPAPLPAMCREQDVMCYANRRGDDYTFVRAPGREAAPERLASGVWPAGSEAAVERVYRTVGWSRMLEAPTSIVALRAHHGLRFSAFGTDERFFLVLLPAAPDAVLRFRSSHALDGEIVDAMTGDVLSRPHFTGPATDLWDVPVPSGQAGVVLMTMTRGEAIE